MNILLTGATGFLGKKLAHILLSEPELTLTVAVRRRTELPVARLIEIRDLDGYTDWSDALVDQRIVIHTAARAHIMNDKAADSLAEYRRVNVEGTRNLARQAAAAGVKRFIFISTIGVNGNANGRLCAEDDRPEPAEPYAQSKWEAEQGLWDIQQETGMEIVIIRPPLIYGACAPGNFGTLVRWLDSGVPLPLGAIRNKRSLVGIDNLVDLIVTCMKHPAAANQLFLAGDGEDLSTTELLQNVAGAMGKPSRLIRVPPEVLRLGATLLGKQAIAQRLLGSLQVDISKTRKLLGWTPPYSVEEGLKRCFEGRNTEKRG